MSLKLLQNYHSDSSSSEEDTIQEGPPPCQKTNTNANKCIDDSRRNLNNCAEIKNDEPKQLLPIPSVLKNMFVLESDSNCSESLTLDDGRVRSFPHVRGNWASFVYISLNESEAVKKQCEILNKTLQKCSVPVFSDIRYCTDFHISLTKTLVFRHHWIDSFISSLKEVASLVQRFSIIFDEFEVYVNEEKTRTFVGMKVHSSSHLLHLIRCCDKAVGDFDLDAYYEDASFHVSIGWTVGDTSTILKNSILQHMNKAWMEATEEDVELQSSIVDTIQLKTGNKLYEFPMKP